MGAAEQARDEGIYQAMLGAPELWLIEARRVVREVAASMPTWTADDIWARIAQPPEPRALGAVLRDLAEQGEIVKTGQYRNSTRPEAHARPLACWRATAPSSTACAKPVEQSLF